MTENDEKLAYLLDGHGGEEADDAIDEALGDVNLQYRMRRYLIIGEAMRHQLPRRIDTDFHKAVMASVHAEAAIARASKKQPPAAAEAGLPLLGWARLRPYAGLAVAASVALVTVALWQPLKNETDQSPNGIATVVPDEVMPIMSTPIQATPVTVSTRLQAPGTRWRVERDLPGLQQKLNGYLVNHTEYSNPVQGLIPQARVAGFDTPQ